MLSRFSRVRLCATLWTAAHRLLGPQDSQGKNTGVGRQFLLPSDELLPPKSLSQDLILILHGLGLQRLEARFQLPAGD